MIIRMQDEGNNTEREELLKTIGQLCLQKEGVPQDTIDRVEVSLSLVSDEEIREINREYRGIDKVTDVLSFPMFTGGEEIKKASVAFADEDAGSWTIPAGDIVVCEEMIRKQAAEYGHSEERELAYLMTHSMLHLLGYDHEEEEDKKIMRAREEEIMKEMRIER